MFSSIHIRVDSKEEKGKGGKGGKGCMAVLV